MTEQVRPRFSMETINLLIQALDSYADSLENQHREQKQQRNYNELHIIVKKIREIEGLVIQLKRITGEIKPYDTTPAHMYHRFLR